MTHYRDETEDSAALVTRPCVLPSLMVRVIFFVEQLSWRIGRTAMKVCNICLGSKPLDAFNVLKKGAQGRHPACKLCRSVQSKAWYASKRAEIIKSRRERRKQTGADRWHAYGLSLEGFHALVAAQSGRCAICFEAPTGRGFHVDHCHRTGQIRGLLCRGCNLALGNMKDDPARLVRAADYLRGFAEG
jgi:hypothetical protein